MQFSLGSGDYEVKFNSYNDDYGYCCSENYKIEMNYKRIRGEFCSRLHKILSNKIFDEQVFDQGSRSFTSILFTNIGNIGKGGILEYSPAIRGGSLKESHNETISRAVLGFESVQKLLKFEKTPIWTDNIYYKYTDEELLHYFGKLILKIDIPIPVVPVPDKILEGFKLELAIAIDNHPKILQSPEVQNGINANFTIIITIGSML